MIYVVLKRPLLINFWKLRLSDKCVYIVGGGPSLINFNFGKLIKHDVIAINASIFDIPYAKVFLTMDYTFLHKSGITGPSFKSDRFVSFVSNPSEKVFVVGFENNRFKKESASVIIDTFFNIKYDLHLFNKIIFSTGRGGIGLSFDEFRNGSDSGYSAIQLAIIKGYSKIYLLGFDFTVSGERTHYHLLYGNKNANSYVSRLNWFLTEYDKMFKDIRDKTNTKVFSCSKISKLNDMIPYIDINNVI